MTFFTTFSTGQCVHGELCQGHGQETHYAVIYHSVLVILTILDGLRDFALRDFETTATFVTLLDSPGMM
jgi:hypothetical protein